MIINRGIFIINRDGQLKKYILRSKEEDTKNTNPLEAQMQIKEHT